MTDRDGKPFEVSKAPVVHPRQIMNVILLYLEDAQINFLGFQALHLQSNYNCFLTGILHFGVSQMIHLIDASLELLFSTPPFFIHRQNNTKNNEIEEQSMRFDQDVIHIIGLRGHQKIVGDSQDKNDQEGHTDKKTGFGIIPDKRFDSVNHTIKIALG